MTAITTTLAEELSKILEGIIDRRVREETCWQPIETAPKDGSEILLIIEINWTHGDSKDDRIGTGHWIGAYWFEEKTGVWRSRCDTWLDNPTHWMPLPSPPKEVK